jgi:hypothetical protein
LQSGRERLLGGSGSVFCEGVGSSMSEEQLLGIALRLVRVKCLAKVFADV